MRHLLVLLHLALLGIVQALSSAGDRLLVVLEEESEKASFSQFWADLEGVRGKLRSMLNSSTDKV
jgi:oligosaccharyltransferase complex subunit beta